MMKWLDCTVSPGQFTGEYSVRGELFDGTGFCLFAEGDDVKIEQEPEADKPVAGWIRVLPGGRKGDLLLVTLPRPTFENGQTVTVNASQVRDF